MNAAFIEEREESTEMTRRAPGRQSERFKMTRHRKVVQRKRPAQFNGFHKRRNKRSGL